MLYVIAGYGWRLSGWCVRGWIPGGQRGLRPSPPRAWTFWRYPPLSLKMSSPLSIHLWALPRPVCTRGCCGTTCQKWPRFRRISGTMCHTPLPPARYWHPNHRVTLLFLCGAVVAFLMLSDVHFSLSLPYSYV
jgi:hypothetical protein